MVITKCPNDHGEVSANILPAGNLGLVMAEDDPPEIILTDWRVTNWIPSLHFTSQVLEDTPEGWRYQIFVMIIYPKMLPPVLLEQTLAVHHQQPPCVIINHLSMSTK